MTYIPLLRTLLYFRSGLHWWQLVGKTNVRGFYGANAGSPTYDSLAPQVHSRPLPPAEAGTHFPSN